MKLLIKPFNEKIKLFYSNHGHFHEGDAGLDLYAIKEQVIKKKSTNKIHFGIACENIDSKPYFLMPRSSISKTPLMLANHTGIIDSGYRGNLIGAFRALYFHNDDDNSYLVEKHTRLLQVCHASLCPIYVVLVNEDQLSNTERGSGGFGSTGV